MSSKRESKIGKIISKESARMCNRSFLPFAMIGLLKMPV